jgi:hypothetical protein
VTVPDVPVPSRTRPPRIRPTWPPPPVPYGAFAIVDGLGGVAAPLFAGFAVTLIALVIQISPMLRYPDAALVLFAVAAVLFLQVVQLNARSRGYAVTPVQLREWHPDFDDPDRQRVLAWELTHHRACWVYLVRRTRQRYNVAILAMLLGVIVMLVPRAGLTAWRFAAIGVLGLVTLTELLELADQLLQHRANGRVLAALHRLTRWVAPADPPVARPPFPAEPAEPAGPAGATAPAEPAGPARSQ